MLQGQSCIINRLACLSGSLYSIKFLVERRLVLRVIGRHYGGAVLFIYLLGRRGGLVDSSSAGCCPNEEAIKEHSIKMVLVLRPYRPIS